MFSLLLSSKEHVDTSHNHRGFFLNHSTFLPCMLTDSTKGLSQALEHLTGPQMKLKQLFGRRRSDVQIPHVFYMTQSPFGAEALLTQKATFNKPLSWARVPETISCLWATWLESTCASKVARRNNFMYFFHMLPNHQLETCFIQTRIGNKF